MKPKITLCLALVLSSGLFGCSTATHHSVTAVTPGQNAISSLSALRVGMTIGEADKALGRFGGIRAFTFSSAMRHCYHYYFIPDMNDITLQFDEHDKLVSWKSTNTHDELEAKVFLLGITPRAIDIPHTTNLTVLRAITSAGGYTEFAHTRYFYLIRCGELTKVDMDAIIRGNAQEALTNDIPLKAWDVIYVSHQKIDF